MNTEKEKDTSNPQTLSKSDSKDVLSSIMTAITSIDKRIQKLEASKTGDEFKLGVQSEDIEAASASKESIDPRLVNIVEEILGDDFMINVESYTDRPGFLFTVIVPSRLSNTTKSKRPIMEKDSDKYKIDKNGDYEYETYQPEDRRSRHISSTASFDAIREHCNLVRANIVATHQKLKKPIPEFRLK